jgi:thiamine kinase-like enzyme
LITPMPPLDRAASLPCWSGKVDPQPLSGGMTNHNFTVEDRGRKLMVRIGEDNPVHGILRWHEKAASEAAAEANISPRVLYAEPGALVMEFIEGKTFDEPDIRANIQRIAALLRRAHHEVGRKMQGATLAFWPFQVNRAYMARLKADNSRHLAKLARYDAINSALEAELGPIELVFGHNDLLPANILDDGQRLWLIDWDHAGFNTPFFDLGGLASNARFSTNETDALLAAYFARPADAPLRRGAEIMTVISLLRETLWSMVSERHAMVDFDYAGYTAKNEERLEAAIAESLSSAPQHER